MHPDEAAATLSEFEYRGHERWVVNKTKVFYRGEKIEKNVFVLPDPQGGSAVGNPIFTPFEAIAIASALHREELQQTLDDTTRQG